MVISRPYFHRYPGIQSINRVKGRIFNTLGSVGISTFPVRPRAPPPPQFAMARRMVHRFPVPPALTSSITSSAVGAQMVPPAVVLFINEAPGNMRGRNVPAHVALLALRPKYAMRQLATYGFPRLATINPTASRIEIRAAVVSSGTTCLRHCESAGHPDHPSPT